jgi:predicted transcriptional regulator
VLRSSVRKPGYHKITRPSPKVDKFLGALEAQVMDYLWREGSGTVRDLVEHLARTHPVAYNTMLTVMTRLNDKGLLTRELEDRTYRYRAARSREEFLGEMSGRIVDDLLADFGEVAIAQFLTRIEQVSPDKLAALLKLARERAENADER